MFLYLYKSNSVNKKYSWNNFSIPEFTISTSRKTLDYFAQEQVQRRSTGDLSPQFLRPAQHHTFSMQRVTAIWKKLNAARGRLRNGDHLTQLVQAMNQFLRDVILAPNPLVRNFREIIPIEPQRN